MSLFDIYACTNGDFIYKYVWLDEIWVELPGSGKKQWRGISCTDKGDKIICCAWKDYIYESIDKGKTWFPITKSLSNRSWTGIACDSLAKFIYACTTCNDQNATGDYIYISKNSGKTWNIISKTIGKNQNGISMWSAISCSGDGRIIAAAELSGNIWVSKNSGTTWTNSSLNSEIFPLKIFNTSDICVSGELNSNCICAVSIPNKLDIGYAYTSTNNGDTWNKFPLNQKSNCVTIANTGSLFAVGTSDNYIYTSDDSGFTFSQQLKSRIGSWSTITISPLDDLYVAAEYNGFIYTSTNAIDWTMSPGSLSKPWIDSCIASDS